jgi:hypothetical protein
MIQLLAVRLLLAIGCHRIAALPQALQMLPDPAHRREGVLGCGQSSPHSISCSSFVEHHTGGQRLSAGGNIVARLNDTSAYPFIEIGSTEERAGSDPDEWDLIRRDFFPDEALGEVQVVCCLSAVH